MASDTAAHSFLPVAGHPDDDECTHREDGTDATYCGLPEAAHAPDGREPKPCPRCGEACHYDGWDHVHKSGLGVGSCRD